MEDFSDKSKFKTLVQTNNLMDLLPFLLNREKRESFKITPSEFMAEMSLSTNERHKMLCSRNSTRSIGTQSIPKDFTVTPTMLIFQNFDARSSLSLQIEVRNCRKVLMPLKMICPKSSYFSAKFVGPPLMKVAPGLSVTYEVSFYPRELRDYKHYLEFRTNNDYFSVPVIGIGPRPLLDIPDEIIVPPAPVKISSTKIVIVKNVGMVPASFTLSSKGSFRLEPSKGYLRVQELVKISVIFESYVAGSCTETVYLNFETGEKLAIVVHGSADNVNVRLDKNCIVHDDTYIGLQRSKAFRLQNNSNHFIKFTWKKNKSMAEDLAIIDGMKDKFIELKDLEVLKNTKQNFYKVCNYRKHELAWDRILEDELKLLQDEEFNFQHSVFEIQPQSGEIFPKGNAELIAVFRPKSFGSFFAEAYLEVSGREERLILEMRGNAIGPHIAFSIEVLDLDFIFLCSVHSYEVVSYNKGDIPGTIVYVPEPLVFGGKVNVAPPSRYLRPDEHAALVISFTSNRHGDFIEKLKFLITESGEFVYLVIKGRVVSPTLHFDKSQIDFGTISVGFPVSRDVTLSNLSMVPVTFSLRVLSDGTNPSMSYEQFANFKAKPYLPRSPKEFSINPQDGVVEPFSSRTVTLTLTANIARRWVTHLMVDMWDSETESVSCPIRFNSQIAVISVEPSTISIPFCFINFPYTRLLTIQNHSRIFSFFSIIPPEPYEGNPVSYSANTMQGVIDPKGVVKVMLTIVTCALGRQTLPLNVLILGNDGPYDMCTICCVGQGPVITHKPSSLQWGEVNLLQESSKTLCVRNESPIPANLILGMSKIDSPWMVSPSSCLLSPEEKITIVITLFLRDRGKYADTLRIQVSNGKGLQCALSASGIGNSLLLDPDITDKYDLGVLFSHRLYQYNLYVKNEGTKNISMVWCPIDDYKTFASLKFVSPPDLIFKLEPTKLELPGGSAKTVVLDVLSKSTGFFSHTFYCYANIESPSKELYMTSVISAEFVEPLINFDKSEIRFYSNIGPEGKAEKLEDDLTVMNLSVLPITIHLVVNHPFYINHVGEAVNKVEYHLTGNERKEISLKFKVETNKMRQCRIFKDKLTAIFKEHSKKHNVSLIGEVNYPNVIVIPRFIDFDCIPLGTSAYREFVLINVSPVVVNFEFCWQSKISRSTYQEGEECSRVDVPTVSNDFDHLLSERSIRILAYMDSDEELTGRSKRDLDDFKDFPSQLKMKATSSTGGDSMKPSNENELVPPQKPVMKTPSIKVEKEELKEILYPLIKRYFTVNEDLQTTYSAARETEYETIGIPEISKLFDISPFYGRLREYESQIISISFMPNDVINLRITVNLDIESGPTETLVVDAKAANLYFKLNKSAINFGRQLFCETANEYMRITNTSLLAFDYETDTIDPGTQDINEEFPVEAGVVVITPRAGHVAANSDKFLRIQYHPGMPGNFKEKFQLRIGYLDPVTIHVKGCGVFPQVHFGLPRPEIQELPVEIGYAALASITSDWMLYPSDHQAQDNGGQCNRNEQENAGYEYYGEYDEFPEVQGDWTEIKKTDLYPCQIAIQLATERIMAMNVCLSFRPQIFYGASNNRTIPLLTVPAYEIDLGTVTVGREAEEVFKIANYGPLNAILYFSYEKDNKHLSLYVKVKNRCEIRVGASISVTVSFCPKRSKFPGAYEKVRETFCFEVQYGARIPVVVSAVVTHPFVSLSTANLNFGEVKCGNCKVMTLKFKNSGWVVASWSLSFRLNPKDVSTMHQAGIIDGRSAFHLAYTRGTLLPNESCFLQISFRPDFGGKFAANLMVKVEEGFEDQRVSLIGEGIEPRLKISDSVIVFEPILPHTRKFFKSFTIQNPCNFPVEFYFPDLDEQIFKEEKVLRALTSYYNTYELLLPARNPGESLPSQVFEFYHIVAENAAMKYSEVEREKQLVGAISASASIISQDSRVYDIGEKKKSKIKKTTPSTRPRSTLVLTSSSLPMSSMDLQNVFRDKTADEVEDIILEYLKGISVYHSRYDPVRIAVENVIPPPKEEFLEPYRGLVVILHEAPYVNLTSNAQHLARVLRKKIISVDRIILEEIALGRFSVTATLKGTIDQAYNEKKMLSGSDSEGSLREWNPATEDVEHEQFLEDLFQEYEIKLSELFQPRDRSTSKGKEDKNSSRGSSRKNQTPSAKALKIGGQSFEILEETVYEILHLRLQQEALSGLIVDGMRSRWFSSPVATLKTLIKACGNMSHVFVFCFVNPFSRYKEFIKKEESKEGIRVYYTEMKQDFVVEETLRILEEEPEEEFLALDMDMELKTKLRKKFISGRHDQYTAYLKEVGGNSRPDKKARQTPGKTPPKAKLSSPKNRSKSMEEISRKSKEKEKTEASVKVSRMPIESNLDKENLAHEKIQFLQFDAELEEIRNFLEHWDKHRGSTVEPSGQLGLKAKKNSATPRKTSVSDEEPNKTSSETGVPLWLLDMSNPNSKLNVSVYNCLAQSLEQFKSNVELDGWTSDIPEEMTFSVVSSTQRGNHGRLIPEFGIENMEKEAGNAEEECEPTEGSLNDTTFDNVPSSDSQISMKPKRKSADQIKGRSTESRTSVMSRSAKKKNLAPVEGSSSFKSRWVLQPGEITYWRITFHATEIGKYEQSFQIHTVPPLNNYAIKATAVCDIPRLDMNPENLFSRVAASKPLDHIYSPSFFYSHYYFDFGSIVPNTNKEEGRQRELHSIFSLTNISAMPVQLKILFADDALRDIPEGSQNFDLDPTSAAISPDQTCLLNVYASPTKYGGVEEVILLIVKDNPKIETVRVKCYGVKVNLTLEPKAVDFDRMLLFRKDKRRITICNSNFIPLFVILSGHEKLPSQFRFSNVKGWIQPMSSTNIEITYCASEVQVVNEEVVHVLVYDRVDALDPVQILNFTVSVEAYDAAVEIYFATREENHVDFGDIRVENEYRKIVTLKNTGKYLLGFKTVINYDLLENYGKELFQVTPEEGKLATGKPFQLTVVFQAKNEIEWKRLPLFSIHLTEPYNEDELVASIPIQVSARTFFSRCLIRPSSDINMGPVQVNSQKTLLLSIENKGQFSFSYWVEVSTEELPPETITENTKKSARKASEASSKEKNKKGGPISLKVGPFEISPGAGTVDVKETFIVNITFSPNEVKNYEEVVVIRTSESPPNMRDGNELKIVAEGCIPQINFNDPHSMYREHYIKQSDRDLTHLPDVGFQTIYTIESSVFLFKNVCLGKTVEGRIHLENKGQIDCLLTTSVNKPEVKRSRTQMESENENFWIKPQELLIPPYESNVFVVCFRPDVIQVYKTQITIILVMPEKYSFVTQVINVVGSVCTPEIEVVEPMLLTMEGKALINFSPTTPGRKSVSPLSFTNIGKIDAKVVLEIYRSESSIFTLLPKPTTKPMLKASDFNKPIDHTTVVSMMPGQTAEFEAVFSPIELGKYTSEIRLFVIENGYENLSFVLQGEAFLEDVILERIQISSPFTVENPVQDSACNQTTPSHYVLNLGHCFVAKKKKILARLANKTEKDYFRFEWQEMPSYMTVMPKAGHLYPGTYKEVYVVFAPQESMEMEQAPLTCSLKKIRFPSAPPLLSWDTRLVHNQSILNEAEVLQMKSFNRTSSRQESVHLNEIQICGYEPDHEDIADTDRELVLYLSAIADYARLQCDATVISFMDTFMFQTRTYSLGLENLGNVPVDYSLQLKSVTSDPLKFEEGTQVNPSSLTKIMSEVKVSAEVYRRKLRKNSCDGKIPKMLDNECFLETSHAAIPKEKPSSAFIFSKPETINETYNPFRVENCSGTIGAREKTCCQISFAPLEVNEYKGTIHIKVDNAHPEHSLPEITLTARSIMPHCHFDIPESDYILAGRRDYSRPGPIGSGPGMPLDPEVKAIEFGRNGRNDNRRFLYLRQFYAINPSEEDYTFSWTNATQNQPNVVQSLHCSCMDGSIQAGRQKLMEFVFVSKTPGTYEYFWKFCIPEREIETVFLFAIFVSEPVIYFLPNNLIMRPTSVNSSTTATITLVNQDEVTSEFFFIPETLYSEGRQNSLKVQPLSGKVGPKSEINFRITFTGKTGGKTLFHLKCKLKKLQNPITVTVEVTTYSVEPIVTFEDLRKRKQTVDPYTSTIIDFGKQLQIDRSETITFNLTNVSKTSFYYKWVYDKRELARQNCFLTTAPADGQVTSYGRSECTMTIVFMKKSSIIDLPINLKITKGPNYVFLVSGSASDPVFEFSFFKYDFGYCSVQTIDFCFYQTTLTFKNKDKVDLLLESESLHHLKNFSFEIAMKIVPPGKEIKIPIRFYPKETIKYEEEIKFLIGGVFERTVVLHGQGADFKVCLADVSDASIKIPAVRIGKKESKQFKIVNKGMAKAILLVGFADQLPVDVSNLITAENNCLDLSKDRGSNPLTLTPSKVLMLKPKEIQTLYLEYAPLERMFNFTNTVCLQFQERVEPLSLVTVSAIGPEFSLDRNYITFGAVVINCSTTCKLKLINSGDIGAKFFWEAANLGDEFSIKPISGYLSAESDLIIEVTFHPKVIKFCIKRTVTCKILLSETESYHPLTLKLAGDCIDLPEPEKSIAFKCPVRESDQKTITITNKTSAVWHLKAIFSGEHFEGYDMIFVPPMSTADYEINYRPTVMTLEESPHQGSLFYSTPDGSGELIKLIGISLPPNPCEIIEREIPCKTKYVELLKVKNWLRSHQRFKVIIDCVGSDSSEDLVYSCSGSDQLEVPPSAEKDYRLNFFAYKVGRLNFSVKFKNEETAEYLHYDLTFNIVMCDPLETISMKATVRQFCRHEIKLENPLTKPIQYKIECSNPEIMVPAIEPVPPLSTVTVAVSFRPLHPGENNEKLRVSCPELGVFPVDLHLTALEPVFTETVRFEATLGSIDVQSIQVPNYFTSYAVFHCRVNSDEFRVEEKMNVPSQDSAAVEITYEPSCLGQTLATLTLESEQAGNFTFSLVGNASRPQPKGPYVLKPGSGVNIPFKNVFREIKTFHVYIDNPAFYLKSNQEEIAPGSEIKVSVNMHKLKSLERLSITKESGLQLRFPLMGQLVVECYNPHIKWQFYLKGIAERQSVLGKN